MSLKNLTQFFVLLFVVLSLASVGLAETWHLAGGESWENIADSPDGKYMLAVAEIKQLISSGDSGAVAEALLNLKANFPQAAGADLDSFMVAEVLYAEGKWVKATREYDNFISKFPESRFFESALERQYSIALAFLNGQKRKVLKVLKLSGYEEASKIMHGIADRAGDAPIAKRGLISLARGLDRRGRYLDAYETWADISSRWPTGQMGRDSLLGMAETLHSAYKGPMYDASSLASSRSYYKNFKLRYPELAEELKIDKRIETINEEFAYKQFQTGQYYSRTEDMAAANLYYQQVIDSWPQSKAAKLAREQLEKTGATEKEDEKNIGRRMFKAGNVILDDWLDILTFTK